MRQMIWLQAERHALYLDQVVKYSQAIRVLALIDLIERAKLCGLEGNVLLAKNDFKLLCSHSVC